MALIRATSGSSSGSGSLKDVIKSKVFNGGFTSLATLAAFSNRVTINEGGIVADKTNHTVYIYVDFTCREQVGGTNAYAIIQFTSVAGETLENYYPISAIGSTVDRNTNFPLITDLTSTSPSKQLSFGWLNASAKNRIFTVPNITINANDHYIVYTAYTYG